MKEPFTEKHKIKDIFTKFFFRGEMLCYQLIVETTDEQKMLHGSFENYTDYKTALDAMHEKMKTGAPILVPIVSNTIPPALRQVS